MRQLPSESVSVIGYDSDRSALFWPMILFSLVRLVSSNFRFCAVNAALPDHAKLRYGSDTRYDLKAF